MITQNHQDYTTNLGIGIRVRAENCQVIRKVRGSWHEFGPVYEIPVDRRLMVWTLAAIPPGVLAVALRHFEIDIRHAASLPAYDERWPASPGLITRRFIGCTNPEFR